MGGNCSYKEDWGGVPKAERTHTEMDYTIGRKKVVVFTENRLQKKNILNSNTANTTYIIANVDEKGILTAQSINVYEGHNLKLEINVEFDSNGEALPFNNGKGSHAHLWEKDPKDGNLKRKRHQKGNCFPIDSKFDSMVSKMVIFNKEKNKWKEKK